MSSLDRRQFLKAMGGGLIVGFSTDPLAEAQYRSRSSGGPVSPSDFNAFLRVGEDGRVTCFTGKVELGQGIITSLAQMLAEELDVPLASVDMVMGDTDLCPYDAWPRRRKWTPRREKFRPNGSSAPRIWGR
jgi:isoquinoline 1-oxidoreductase